MAKSPLMYINTNVDVTGNLTVDFYNNIELNVTKIKQVPNARYLPLYCYRIAVISNFNYHNQYSMGAGLTDFLDSLKYGKVYPFDIRVGNSEKIAESINMANNNDSIDCICILRGGGDEDIAKLEESTTLTEAIKNSKLPIILGIGHSTNKLSFAKYVAKECINPTEAAYFINERFERLRADIEKKLLICEQYLKEHRKDNTTYN